MTPGHTKLIAGIAGVAGVAVFLGWRLLGFVEDVWGPEANPFAPRRMPAMPRPPVQVAEIVPPPETGPREMVAYQAQAGDLPGWRVRAGSEVGADATAVAAWRGSSEPVWRQPLGGQGHSTPIVIGERIYFTIADGGPTLWLVCFDFGNGYGMWRQPVSREPFPQRHEKTSDAASTPCSDGARLFVAHASIDTLSLTAFTLAGERLWTTPIGPFNARWGFTSSPVWHGGIVVVGAENAGNGFLAAVEADTGRILWRRGRPRASDESYSSPVVRIADAPAAASSLAAAEIVMAGLDRIQAVALADGRLLWGSGGVSSTSGATPAVVDDICVATSGFPTRAMVALRTAPGNDTPAVLWREDRDSEIPYVPSPLVHAGRLYVVHDDGVAHCRDIVTGHVAWKRRVGGTFSASPVVVGNEVLCADESGRCTLLDFDEGSVRHEFAVAGGCFATPIVVRGRLIIRTTAELVAFDIAARR
jgi:outer membrane protein assembly factor BamB